MPIRAALFDLDGTLLDTLKDLGDSMNAVLKERGFPEHPIADYAYFIGDGAMKLVQRSLPPGEYASNFLDDALAQYKEAYQARWNRSKPYPGIPDCLDGLVTQGIRLAVVSNKPDHFTQQCVKMLLTAWDFDKIQGQVDSIPKKPAPDSALKVADALGCSPSECAFIGDTGVDMETGNRAGMLSIGVLWGFRPRSELEAHGAKYLIEHPSELPALLKEHV